MGEVSYRGGSMLPHWRCVLPTGQTVCFRRVSEHILDAVVVDDPPPQSGNNEYFAGKRIEEFDVFSRPIARNPYENDAQANYNNNDVNADNNLYNDVTEEVD